MCVEMFKNFFGSQNSKSKQSGDDGVTGEVVLFIILPLPRQVCI